MQWCAWQDVIVAYSGASTKLARRKPYMDGVPTLNQWVLLAEPGAPPSVVTIECAGILVGSTAREIADHISQSWDNGQTAVNLLRMELGDGANVHVPLRNGGVMLHKLQGKPSP